jgi:gamma-D-glutamyl-L-lysine dipeptidyl-peptidase
MEYGICNLSIVPVRAEPSDRSEQVTQLLFGECFEITGKNKQWKKVRLAYDDYTGWIDEKQYQPLQDEVFRSLRNGERTVTLDLVQILVSDNIMSPIVIGSDLPFFNGKECRIGEQIFGFDGNTRNPDPASASKNLITENAFIYLNSPYLWGGRSPFGIDCSGFTQMAYKLSGIKLRRDASQQAEEGHTVNFLEEAEPGDLIFFDNAEGRIIHVGILLPDNRIIHASGKVRIDKIDHHGIFNTDTKKYSHKLRLIKRYF